MMSCVRGQVEPLVDHGAIRPKVWNVYAIRPKHIHSKGKRVLSWQGRESSDVTHVSRSWSQLVI